LLFFPKLDGARAPLSHNERRH